MNSRERVLAVLNGQKPDRIPHGENGFNSEFYYEITGKKTLCYSGWDELEALWRGERDRVVEEYIDALCTMSEALEWDYIRVPVAPEIRDYSGFKRLDEKHYQDDRGNVFKFDPSVGNIALPVYINPDMEIGDLPDIHEPFSVKPGEMDIAEGVIRRMGREKFIVGRLPFDGTFPYLATVGMEEYLIRMITDPEFVHASSALYTQRTKAYIDAYAAAGCNAVQELADYGDNRTLIMGKGRYDEFIVPYLKQTCDMVHAAGMYFIKHTDGYVMDALPSFVEVGINGWHGIQPAIGMEIKKIREKVGNDLCLWGGVDVSALIDGSPEDVRRLVRKAVKYGAEGGLLLACGNVIEHGTKVENYMALLEQLKEIYTFPIDYDAIEE